MLSEQAKKAKREYMRQWREKNKDHVNNYMKEWKKRPGNEEKVKESVNRYWENKAKQEA